MFVAQRLAQCALRLRAAPLSQAVLHHAKRAVIDWYAAALPGSQMQLLAFLEQALEEDLDRGAARLVSGRRATVRAAALINGAAAHAAEVDDSFRDAMYHPGAATIAAALAVAQSIDANGLQFLRAVVVGYEVSTRIGVVMGRAHYKFWHNTGTVGTFGAAAAAAELLQLDEAGFAHALATAGTFAAGLHQAFRMDPLSKPLHPGRAAEGGLLAAQLAACHVTGSLDIFEGETGFGRALGADPDWSQVAESFGRDFHIMRMTFKNHIGCGHTFPAIDGALELQRRHQIDVDDIEHLNIATYKTALDVACHVSPETANQARFSMPYVVATALVHGSVRMAAYEPKQLEDPRVRLLMSRISVSVDPDIDAAFPGQRAANVEMILRNGRRLMHFQPNRKGDPEQPLDDRELEAKLIELGGRVIGDRAVQRLLVRLWALETSDDLSLAPER